MTFQDDEIAKINEEKLKQIKKHKTNAQIPTTPNKPNPPIIAINSLIAEIYDLSFPLLKAEEGLKTLRPQPVPAQKVLDNILGQYKSSMERAKQTVSEDLLKAFSATLLNILRELDYFEFITLTKNKAGEYVTAISKKGIIYANTINYLVGPNMADHYALYNQIGIA